MRKIIPFIFLFALMASCERRPPLFLYDEEEARPAIDLGLDIRLDYNISYDWSADWTYGWDVEDIEFLGDTILHEPEEFELRAYFLGESPNNRNSKPFEDIIYGKSYRAKFYFGYYNILVWSRVKTADNVQNIVFEENSTYDSVVVYTRESMSPTRYQEPRYTRAFYEPEELMAGYTVGNYISPNMEDYDSLDVETNTYYMSLKDTLYPVTYRYYTQVRFHNNNGRVSGIDGEANLSGMAKGTTLNSRISSSEAITVHYNMRFKKGQTIKKTGELVDVAGGRCISFGIPNINYSRVSRAEDVRDKVRHYIDLNVIFNNGMDSTMVFDVTDQVRKKYRGGVITIDLDVDTIRLPSRPGGSGFDAVVKDYEEEEYEFEM